MVITSQDPARGLMRIGRGDREVEARGVEVTVQSNAPYGDGRGGREGGGRGGGGRVR